MPELNQPQAPGSVAPGPGMQRTPPKEQEIRIAPRLPVIGILIATIASAAASVAAARIAEIPSEAVLPALLGVWRGSWRFPSFAFRYTSPSPKAASLPFWPPSGRTSRALRPKPHRSLGRLTEA